MLYETEVAARLYDNEYTRTDDIPFYLAWARRQGGMVLEAACGTGRVLLPLAREGVVVTGLDSSEAMLRRADEKLLREPAAVQSNVTLVQADVRDFSLPNTYGMAFIAARSFCLLLTVHDQEAALRCLHRHLVKSGVLIVDLFDPDPTLLHVGSTGRHTFDDPETGRQYEASDRTVVVDSLTQVKTIERTWELEPPVQTTWQIRYTWPFELQHLIRLCGFRIESVLGGYDGEPFNTPGGRLIVVARKS
ncbi:MAG TPA: class I SAM-dependent methyltransferase [Candidatus Xenobia bacterium]